MAAVIGLLSLSNAFPVRRSADSSSLQDLRGAMYVLEYVSVSQKRIVALFLSVAI